tara:strand:- start:801 stop:917 length:117 start_codon:yes stop_codon:yes gene_type:complete
MTTTWWDCLVDVLSIALFGFNQHIISILNHQGKFDLVM